MFQLFVDDEIKLLLIHEGFVPRYVELVEKNYEYLSKWLAWPPFCKTPDDFKQFVKSSLDKYADGESMTCAIEYHGKIVGNCSFNTINHDLKKVEVGYWLGEEYQGNGIITRVCRFLQNYAFTELKMQKVEISVAENNTPSRAVCERLSMKLEGIITNSEKVRDTIFSHAVYGIHVTET